MAIVNDILKLKGSQVWLISSNSLVQTALELMAEKNVGALVVADADQIVGIFSERDYARIAIELPNFTLATPIRELMSTPVFFVTPDQTIEECLAIMTEKRFRHLPVLEGNKMVGLISIGDLVKHVLSKMDNTIKDLEEYIWIHMI
jgi:CBS domain-containing protein